MTDTHIYYVTVEQKEILTYRVEATDETDAQVQVETADIETLDNWFTHRESMNASVTSVEEVEA